MPNGYGKKIQVDGSWYLGQFSGGEYNGQGKYRGADLSEYDG